MTGIVISQEGVLRGRINHQEGTLSGVINFSDFLKGRINYQEGYERYSGLYSITPSFMDQEFNTSEKVMSRNLTVERIPYSETSNPDGGITINIGG